MRPAPDRWLVDPAPANPLASGCCRTGSHSICNAEENSMPRYVVAREFPEGLEIPINQAGEKACREVIERNREEDVSWVHSYVSMDKKRTYCIYDAPTMD